MGIHKYSYVGPMLKVHDRDFDLSDRMVDLLSSVMGEGWTYDYSLFQANQRIAGISDRESDEVAHFDIDAQCVDKEKLLFYEFLVKHNLEKLGDVVWGVSVYWC